MSGAAGPGAIGGPLSGIEPMAALPPLRTLARSAFGQYPNDLHGRVDDPDGEADFLDTPIDELIAALCRDLGFEPPEPLATPHPPGSGAAAGPMAEGASLAPGAPAVHAPNTS